MSANSRPLKILQVVDRNSSGGIPRIIELIRQSGENFGWQVETEPWYGDSPQDWNSKGVSNRGTIASKLFAMKQRIRQFKPDIIHDHFGGLLSAGFLLESLSAKSIFHLHNELIVHEGSPDEKRTIKTALFRKLLLPRYDAFVTVSEHSSRQLLEVCPDAGGRITILKNAVGALTGEKITRNEAREKLKIDQKALVLVGLGRLVFEKGFEHHLQVLELLKKKIPSALLILAGDGDEQYIQKLHRESEARGISGDVIFAGRTQEPALFYRAADFFLFASHQEPFGLTLLEAMRCECPVLAVLPEKGGGPREFIRHAHNAWVTERDAEETTDAIVRLYLDGTLRNSLLKGGLETSGKFSAAGYAENLNALYKRVRS